MYSTHEAELDIPSLPIAARQVHIVPDLQDNTLLSVGQLCDAGCVVDFTATTMQVRHNDNIVLTGIRTPHSKLWHMQQPDNNTVPVHQQATAHAAIGSASPAELVEFAHAALFLPSLSTLHQALKRGHIHNFPGLTEHTLKKYPPKSIATVKGHLDQIRKNQKSTKAVRFETDEEEVLIEQAEPKSHMCYTAIMETTGQVYTDQTGKFITPSSTGNNYMLILYDYDSNAILCEAFKSRNATDILQAYTTLHKKLCSVGLKPQLQRLDNECSDILKQYMTEQDIDYQLVPPHVHRQNAAERAIRTFKNHFIAGLCSVDKNFPLHLWDKLIPQAVITLNLLRPARINPKLSAWEIINGAYDFNRTPIAPPGIRVLIHDKPTQRGTWAPHALDGWYVGPALESYRCYTIWMFDTRRTRISDTVEWFPSKITMPIASSTDIILAGINDIIEAVIAPPNSAPITPHTDSQVATLKQLKDILTNTSGTARTNTDESATSAPTLHKSDSAPTQDEPALRVEAELILAPSPPTQAAPLRVEIDPMVKSSIAPLQTPTSTLR